MFKTRLASIEKGKGERRRRRGGGEGGGSGGLWERVKGIGKKKKK